MRIAAILCLTSAILLAGFAWWGLASDRGRRMFDEMDGMIPYFAGLLGAADAATGLLLWWLEGRTRRQ